MSFSSFGYALLFFPPSVLPHAVVCTCVVLLLQTRVSSAVDARVPSCNVVGYLLSTTILRERERAVWSGIERHFAQFFSSLLAVGDL